MIFLRPKQEKSNKYSGASKPNAATSFMERPFFIEKNINMFVDGYYSNLSKLFTKRKQHILIPKIYSLKTQNKYYSLLRDHYLKNGCWTWFNNYEVPFYECFYKGRHKTHGFPHRKASPRVKKTLTFEQKVHVFHELIQVPDKELEPV